MRQKEYHKTLGSYFQSKLLYLDKNTQKKPNIRKLVEQPWQQTNGEMWDEVTDTLCNLDFIQAKAAAKMTYGLVYDLNSALQVIPDNKKSIDDENKRQSQLDKYTKDLISYSKGEIQVLEFPRTTSPWNEEQQYDEIERKNTNPTNVDKLKDYSNFLGKEASNLHKYANLFPFFVMQQAWNYSDNGLVFNSFKFREQITLKSGLILSQMNRLHWQPFPQALKILKGHRSVVNSLAITVDGKFAISGSQDNNCILWDLSLGRVKSILKGHTDWVYSVSITPDGSLAISGSKDMTCIVWDLNTGLPISRLKGHTSRVYAVDITPDGKYGVSGSEDKTCILWDLNTGQSLKLLTGHNNEINAIFISPDGKKAISSSKSTSIYWDLTKGKAINTLNGSIKFHGLTLDGRRAIWTSWDTFGLLDLSTYSQIYTQKYSTRIDAMAMTADGKLAILGSFDGKCSLWDLTEPKLLEVLNGHYSPVQAVAITADGRMAVSGSNDSLCILWNLIFVKKDYTSTTQNSYRSTFAITPDGKKAMSGYYNGTCILHNILTGESIYKFEGSEQEITALAISSNGEKAFSGSASGSCSTFDLITGVRISSMSGHRLRITKIVITPDGKRFMSGSWDSTCSLWNLNTGQLVKSLKGHDHIINSLTLTLDGKIAISGSWDHKCIIWDISTGNLINIFDKHLTVITTVAITPDNKRVLSASKDGMCILWDIESCQPLFDFKVGSSRINSIIIMPKGNQALIGSSDGSSLWDLTTGKLIQYQDFPTIEISVTRDGKIAISVSIDATFFWEIETGKLLACLPDTTGPIAYTQNGFILNRRFGDMTLYNPDKNLFCLGATITTIRNIWDFEFNQYQELSADCPVCSHRFTSPASVLATIEEITMKAGLRPEQSPCLELADEVWEDPGLLSNCPKCGEKLKFNPFIAGGD
jgi:WD40 repeat protein